MRPRLGYIFNIVPGRAFANAALSPLNFMQPLMLTLTKHGSDSITDTSPVVPLSLNCFIACIGERKSICAASAGDTDKKEIAVGPKRGAAAARGTEAATSAAAVAASSVCNPRRRSSSGASRLLHAIGAGGTRGMRRAKPRTLRASMVRFVRGLRKQNNKI